MVVMLFLMHIVTREGLIGLKILYIEANYLGRKGQFSIIIQYIDKYIHFWPNSLITDASCGLEQQTMVVMLILMHIVTREGLIVVKILYIEANIWPERVNFQ